ncbi:hypothetical protein WN944_006024 [Citrus x changshan-huyou]|uniref:Uncharacterized protein n=1 Tax=Citrus x changshan-huyou TaxID=2935761 RepID=A0AAP0MIG0_9ROSI
MTATNGVVSLRLMFHRIDGFDWWRLILRKFMSWLLMIAEGELCNSLDQMRSRALMALMNHKLSERHQLLL